MFCYGVVAMFGLDTALALYSFPSSASPQDNQFLLSSRVT